MLNQTIKIDPLSMKEILEVKADGNVTIPYTANFIECNDYKKDNKTEEGKIHEL